MPDARRPASSWPFAAIAVALGFVVFVVMRGFTGQALVTWAVASAIGIVLFLVALAVRNRR